MKWMTAAGMLATLVLSGVLPGCGAPDAGTDTHAAVAATPAEPPPLGDPATQALLGSAERALHARHPGASLVLADQALSGATAERTVCGRYIVVKRHWQGRRYFIANAAEIAVVEKTSARWKTICEDAKPLPGALTGAAVDAAVLAAIPLAQS